MLSFMFLEPLLTLGVYIYVFHKQLYVFSLFEWTPAFWLSSKSSWHRQSVLLIEQGMGFTVRSPAQEVVDSCSRAELGLKLCGLRDWAGLGSLLLCFRIWINFTLSISYEKFKIKYEQLKKKKKINSCPN